jgi:hypothetical protein
MDFLDPKKERRNRLVLRIGYVFVAVAIALGTVILLYQAYGFGFGKDGQVIQNGLLFISSHPSGARIYVNGAPYSANTNTRVLEPSGQYQIKISKDGYRDWQRTITIMGGDVQHFDYPFLFPQELQTNVVSALTAAPAIVSGSPDRRWLLVEHTDDLASFTLYDLKSPATPPQLTITLPATVYTAGDDAQSWQAVAWSSDNRHLLLLHNYTAAGQAQHEYISLDREDPTQSVNVTTALNLTADDTLSLYNGKYDQYFAFDKSAQTLRTTSLRGNLTPRQLNHIIAFQAHADDAIVYVTDQPPSGKVEAGKVSVVLQQGAKTYTLRTFDANAPGYLLDLATYKNSWYVLAGVTNSDGVYLYRNVHKQTSDKPDELPNPWRFLKVANPSYVGFSTTAQFITAESGQQFVIYDADNVETYSYKTAAPLDAPQTHATWMDGNRLLYVSDGKLVVFDYDNQNVQTLQPADPRYQVAFDPAYSYIYNIAPGTTPALTATSLLIKP